MISNEFSVSLSAYSIQNLANHFSMFFLSQYHVSNSFEPMIHGLKDVLVKVQGLEDILPLCLK